MNELSLFTGAGGGIWGAKLLGWRTIGYVEWDEYCQAVIAQRIADGIFPLAPIFADIRLFLGEGYAESYKGMVDVVTAGFPCQPFSTAGKRLGEDDPRNMWPATAECIATVRPRFALLENVPGLTATRYFGRIIGDLTELGYDCKWTIISAAELGAPHLRKRLWIYAADTNSNGEYDGTFNAEVGEPSESLADAAGNRWSEGHSVCGWSEKGGRAGQKHRLGGGCRWWTTEPDVGRVANRVAHRKHRLKATGNGQVPRVVVEAWERLRA